MPDWLTPHISFDLTTGQLATPVEQEHMRFNPLLLLPILAYLVDASLAKPLFEPSYHPVVIWHGLGDSAFSEPMQGFADELRKVYPGMYVRIVNIADDLASDQRASFFGNVNKQVEKVCTDLAADDELRHGFDAIGFSQGGQFMRAYVERCNKPVVRNLITFGSQHMGVSDLPACKPTELLCRLAETALRGGVYTEYAQSNIVTAQYYRDPNSADRYEKYLALNHFLTDINNEIEINQEYKKNLVNLDNMVLLMFDRALTVEPKQSSWFASYSISQDNEPGKKEVEPLRQTESYSQDRLGLRTLDERGSLLMELCYGGHMQINEECLGKIVNKYIGTSPPSHILPTIVRHAWFGLLYKVAGFRASSWTSDKHLAALMVSCAVLYTTAAVLTRAFARHRIELL